MEKLKQLVFDLLEIEKANLMKDKGEYCAAVVVVITQEGRYYEEVEFDNEVEMDAAYAGVVGRALKKNATAIITINTAREQEVAGSLDGYWWGKLQAENHPRSIVATISGPGIQAESISVPFRIENDHVIFGDAKDFERAEIAMLPNWPPASKPE
ncbi:MAG TPA: hypothetical protein VJW51_02720 [Candidatus Acidoferrales bacterium]|nr:hypothetical protein [Candidatus Acidoferrales bacterium]